MPGAELAATSTPARSHTLDGSPGLGVVGYGAELAATAPAQPHDKQLDAMTHGAETCYLGVVGHGADPLGPKTYLFLQDPKCEIIS